MLKTLLSDLNHQGKVRVGTKVNEVNKTNPQYNTKYTIQYKVYFLKKSAFVYSIGNHSHIVLLAFFFSP